MALFYVTKMVSEENEDVEGGEKMKKKKMMVMKTTTYLLEAHNGRGKHFHFAWGR